MDTAREPVTVCWLGQVAYGPMWELQHKLQQCLIDAKRGQPPEELSHLLLLLEHPPVYTLGKSGDVRHLLLAEEGLAARGASFYRIDRGGDITFHGPGQLVGYFLFDLDRFYRDLHRFLRALEEIIILTCADYGLVAGQIPGRTGVWIGPDSRGAERKICALGIRSSRWVTLHGLALNLNTDLSFFQHIVPCGIPDRGVTSFARELGYTCDEEGVRQHLRHHVETVFAADTTFLEGDTALTMLEKRVGTTDLYHTLQPNI